MTSVDFLPSQRFLVLRRIGEGGMGVVYEAMDLERRSRIALKTLRSFDPDALLRFKREFRALQDVRHDNLVNLGEFFNEGGHWYFSMELVDGPDFLGFVSNHASDPQSPESLAPTESAPTLADVRPYRARPPRAEPDTDRLSLAPRPQPQRIERPSLDLARLHSALGQLGRGLFALHDAGLVHRDVKPTNIRVTRRDRLVLLDFGLVSSVLDGLGTSSMEPMGTPVYMAPEQATRGLSGPACDWYSVGVLHFEALTGQLLFEGTAFEILTRKHAEDGPDPRRFYPGAIASLSDLSRDLMRREPSARPPGMEVLRRLDDAGRRFLPSVSSQPPPQVATSVQAPAIPLVGRALELAALRAAFDNATFEGPLCVLVEGESGIGKTAIVRAFRRQIAADDDRPLVLFGRCREREAVPYAGIDEVVDGLSRFLVGLGPTEAAPLLPERIDLLGHVFPVLRRVEAIAEAAHPRPEAVNGRALRRVVFTALRELLSNIGEEHAIVIAIDDLQWADADTLALLEELLRPGEAMPLLLVATTRSPEGGEARDSGPSRPLEALGRAVRTIRVGALSNEETVELAELLGAQLSSTRANDARPRVGSIETSHIARESRGNPFFVHELVRHALSAPGTAPRSLLDDALGARIAGLDRHVARLLQIVALAAGPIPLAALARAAGTSAADVEPRIAHLRAACLVRTASGRRPDLVEPYHDRIREVVRARLEPATRRTLHERLAVALETEGHENAENLARHWRGAGDSLRAAAYATRAADEAASALAFDRAARLYRLALSASESEASSVLTTPRWELWARLGDVLANVGRSAEAAKALRKAALVAPPERALLLRNRAADQLLRAGHIDAGLAEVAGVMQTMGVWFPRTTLAALVFILVQRFLLKLRGLRFAARAANVIPARELTVVDTCLSLTTTHSIVDPLRGAYFQARALWLSLDAGEPSRIAHAVAWETLYVAMSPGNSIADVEATHERALRLAHASGSAEAAVIARAIFAGSLFVLGQSQRCVDIAAEVDRAMQGTPGASAEQQRVRSAVVGSLACLGDFKELGTRVAAYQRECDELGDRYGAANLRVGLGNMVWLADDRPAAARASVARALLEWPTREYTLVNYYALYALVQADLYEGDGEAAWARITADWPALQRAFLLRPPPVFTSASFLRGRAAVASAVDAARRGPLLRETSQIARRLRRLAPMQAPPMAALLEASVHHLDGRDEDAVSSLLQATHLFGKLGMAIHAAAADMLRGHLVGGQAGLALRDDSDRIMRERGVTKPVRMAAVFLPTIDSV